MFSWIESMTFFYQTAQSGAETRPYHRDITYHWEVTAIGARGPVSEGVLSGQ